MEIHRPFWVKSLLKTWEKVPIAWLSGVRRTGKTTLARSLSNASYYNCDLPSVQERLTNPEFFFREELNKILIFDEIHQLENPSQVLKIASDQFPSLKILATGSSTLSANQKFKDSLTGRKRNILFTPVLVSEIPSFGANLEKRVLSGGLPPALLSKQLDHEFYSEWLDSFYARDIQELFRIEKRQPFLKALEWLLLNNGQLLDVTKISQIAGVSRPTTTKYLDALEVTRAISFVRPFSQNSEREIVSHPKVYGFDTGFICHVKGITSLRNEDYGTFLENLVLETFQAAFGYNLHFWRDKQGHEIDFVLKSDRESVLAIECKWKEKSFDPKNLSIFRRLYPKGTNLLITSDSGPSTKKIAGLHVNCLSIYDWQNWLEKTKL